jgi:inosine/xanthosine triphosphate pyrophosphatase family protein
MLTDLNLSSDDATLILKALNAYEGVLSTDYERAQRLQSVALADSLRRDLANVRALASRLYPHAN